MRNDLQQLSYSDLSLETIVVDVFSQRIIVASSGNQVPLLVLLGTCQ